MKRSMFRLAALTLALLMCLLTVTSCASSGKKLLTLKKDGISVSFSVNLYQLLLSRSKGTLCAANVTQNGVTAAYNAFWDYQDKFDGVNFQTYAEYYQNIVLNTCKANLVALYLFEREGLSLTDAQLEQISKMMQELVRTDGGGSKTKLNAILAEYGVNYNMLREFYELEMKVNAVRLHLYGNNASKVGDNVKNEFMLEHYVRFRQIFLTATPYVYETDVNGDTILFSTETDNTHRIAYDSGNGVRRVIGTDETTGEELYEKDKNGDVIYYVKDTDYKKIAYNPMGAEHTVKNADGTSKTRELTLEEAAALDAKAQEIYGKIGTSTNAEFEELLVKESDGDTDVSEYNEGIYLRSDLDYTLMGSDSAYLTKIVDALKEMQVGEVRMIVSPSGYHIIRKYECAERAYANAANEAYFTNFYDNLINELFALECQKHIGDIKIDEKVWKDAPRMQDVGVNYYY